MPLPVMSSSATEEDPRVTFHHLHTMRSAGHVSGKLWATYNHITHCEQLRDWGYLTRISRTQFKLTAKGAELIGRNLPV